MVDLPVNGSRRRSVLRPIPRRTPLTFQRNRVSPPQLKIATTPPQTSAGYLFRRSLEWFVVSVEFCILVTWDGLHGRHSARDRGRRLRHAFERLGGMAVQIGRQLALRIDLLPYALCDELYAMRVDVPPFELGHALRRVEAAAGKPLTEIFSVFDPVPMRATLTANIYQATLKSGEKVAVKVRRPGASEQMAADLKCMSVFTYVPEVISLVKKGFLEQVRDGLRQVLVEEVDFTREARYQRIFRRWAKKAKFGWLYAPRVYTEYCSPNVMVSEFVSGILYSEILAIVADQNEDALKFLESLDISPRKMARRVLHLQFWNYLEALFYFAEPQPADIAITAGGRLVLLEFGSRGTTSRKLRRDYVELLERISERDAGGMADVALHMLSPLPHLDVYELKKKIEGSFHRFLFAMRDNENQWWERAAMNFWLALIEATRPFNIAFPFEILHLARASIFYDSLAYPLDPKLKLLPRYRRYVRAAAKRGAREVGDRLDKIAPIDYAAQFITAADQAETSMRRASWGIGAHLLDLPPDLTSSIAKVSFVFRELIRFLMHTVMTVVAAFLVASLWRVIHNRSFAADWVEFLTGVLYHPFVIFLVVINLVIAIRRVLFRLADVDHEGYER